MISLIAAQTVFWIECWNFIANKRLLVSLFLSVFSNYDKLLPMQELLETIFNKRIWNIVFFKVLRWNNNCCIKCTIFDILFDVYNGLNASL